MIYHYEEIIKYIEFFRESIPNSVEIFTEGNCVRFAILLERQFPGGKVLYNLDHACYKYNNDCYDITGLIEEPKSSLPIEEYGIYKLWDMLKPNYETE